MAKFDRKNKEAPVNVGEVFVAKCEGKGSKGAGMFRKEGFVIFVEDAEEGKEYEIKVTKVLDRVAFGEIMQNISSNA